MLGHHFDSPWFAVGFLVVVIYLVAVYFTARERAKVARMRGRKRFQPDWRRTGRAESAYRRRGTSPRGTFSPEWTRHKRGRGGSGTHRESGGNAPEGDREPSSGRADRKPDRT